MGSLYCDLYNAVEVQVDKQEIRQQFNLFKPMFNHYMVETDAEILDNQEQEEDTQKQDEEEGDEDDE